MTRPLRFLGSRLAQGVVVVLGAVIISFGLTSLIGNPADVLANPQFSTPETARQIKHVLGYDQPVAERFARYLVRVVQGDLGTSYRSGDSAAGLVAAALPYTLMLVGGAMVLATLVAVPAAVLSVLRQGGWCDRIVRRVIIVGQGVPDYWLGLLLTLVFAVELHALPSVGYSGFSSLILPTIAMAVPFTATLMRLVRAQLLDVMGLDFVTTLRSKGQSDLRIVTVHGMRNALPQVVTFLALQTGIIIGSSLVVETAFGWPGMGSLLINAVGARDVAVVQAVIICVGVCFVALNLLADVIVLALDPRIRVGTA